MFKREEEEEALEIFKFKFLIQINQFLDNPTPIGQFSNLTQNSPTNTPSIFTNTPSNFH